MSYHDVTLDVHIGLSKDTNPIWQEKCLESVRLALQYAPFAVHLYLVDGVPGHVGAMRHHGYSLGTSNYVSYVDDDDYILPDAFKIVENALLKQPDVVFPREYHLVGDSLTLGNQRHHLPIYRRDRIIDQRSFAACGDVAQINAMRFSNIIDVTEPVYVHRRYLSRCIELRRSHPEEHERSKSYSERLP